MPIKSEWRVQSNYISGVGERYIAYRIKDLNEVVHSGNIEHYGEYSEDREAVQKLVDELNRREGLEND